MCIRKDVFLWRQCFAVSATFVHSMSNGFMLAFPSVLSPSLLSPNGTDITATPDQASWIAASNGLAGIVGFFIQSPIMQVYGRKSVYITLNIWLIIGWIIFILAKSITALYVARIIQGLNVGGLFINSIIMSEYSHPTRRGYFNAIKKSVQCVGILVCHALSLNYTWRQVAGVALVPACLSLIITLFWPESPSFLAMKGRFKDCEESFLWLNGKSEKNDKELKELILAQKDRLDSEKQKHNKLASTMLNKGFLRAFFIVSLLTLVLDASGKFYYIAYIIDIMIEVTGDKTIAVYCSLGADCLSIIALITSCIVIRRYNRRTLLLGFGGFSVLLMFSLGVMKLLNSSHKANVLWLPLCIVLLHNFIVNMSVIPVCFTLFGELFPLRYRGMGSCLSGVVFTIFYALSLKVTPTLLKYTGLEGTYATYGVCVLICFVILYFELPETKDKTLQEIEDIMQGVRISVTETKPMLSVK